MQLEAGHFNLSLGFFILIDTFPYASGYKSWWLAHEVALSINELTSIGGHITVLGTMLSKH